MTLTALYAPVYASMCNTSTVSMVAVSYVGVTFITAHIHSTQPVALTTENRTLQQSPTPSENPIELKNRYSAQTVSAVARTRSMLPHCMQSITKIVLHII
jgi:hypothetical protein